MIRQPSYRAELIRGTGRKICVRCGGDLPACRFNQDGTINSKGGKYPMYCEDCRRWAPQMEGAA